MYLLVLITLVGSFESWLLKALIVDAAVVIPEEQNKAKFLVDVSPVRSNGLIFSLIILPVDGFNVLFERLEDNDNDYDGLVVSTVTC